LADRRPSLTTREAEYWQRRRRGQHESRKTTDSPKKPTLHDYIANEQDQANKDKAQSNRDGYRYAQRAIAINHPIAVSKGCLATKRVLSWQVEDCERKREVKLRSGQDQYPGARSSSAGKGQTACGTSAGRGCRRSRDFFLNAWLVQQVPTAGGFRLHPPAAGLHVHVRVIVVILPPLHWLHWHGANFAAQSGTEVDTPGSRSGCSHCFNPRLGLSQSLRCAPGGVRAYIG
jgi:hypothetical protein